MVERKSRDEDKNELERDIADLKEWGDNQYNPGHWIGSGRVRGPVSSLSNHPVLLIIFGAAGLVITLVMLFTSEISYSSLPGGILAVLLELALVYGGLVRLKNKSSKVPK